MAWLTEQQMIDMGFIYFGNDLKLSDKASYYNCKNIRLGNNVRIDDFCVLSAGEGGIDITERSHIGVYSSLIGAGNISIGDFSGCSGHVSIYSSSDDYSGTAMSGPQVPVELTNMHHANVKIGRHVIIGAGSVILPGVTLEDGVAVGALSCIRKDCQSFGIYMGSPARRIAERKRDFLELEKSLINFV